MNPKKYLLVFAALCVAVGSLSAQSPTQFTLSGSDVSASADDGNVPANTIDGNLGTRWSAQGDGQWIRYDLGSTQTVSYVKLAWYQGSARTSSFDVQHSSNGSSWTTAYSGTSSGSTTALETYDFADVSARYVRIVGHGNSSGNGWNSITEAEIWTSTGGGGGSGQVVPFTVESDSVSADPAYWSGISDTAASGGSALEALVSSNSSAPSGGGLVYPFTLNSSATIYLQIKAKAANTSSDSVWVRLDGGSWSQFTFDSTNQYTWRTKQFSSVASGSHSFELRCREDDARVDLVAVTLDTNTPPAVGGGGSIVSAPAFSPGGGSFTSAQSVTLTSATSGSTIRYTTNGTNPTTTSGTVYSGAVSISSTTTLKALAYKSGLTASSVTSATYTITPPSQVATPTFTPPAGTYTGSQSVTISTVTNGASIRYTTNGTTPTTTSGTLYAGAVTVASNLTLKAIAYKSGSTNSAVASAAYVINGGGDLDPNVPPGSNFDLSQWKITLPINSAEEHSAAELVAGYENSSYFYTDSSTGGMVFVAPNLGDTTGGSSYSRSELREMLAPTGSAGAAANNWVISTSSTSAKNAAGGVDGTMNATLSVDHVSTSGDSGKVGRVVVGQIHAPSSEIIRLYYHKRPSDSKGAIYYGHDTPSNSNTYYPIIGDPDNLDPSNGIALGDVWSYEIKVVGQAMTVKVTPLGGTTHTATFTLETGYQDLSQYFKAGVYNQNNTGTSGDYVQATFYALTHVHP